MKDELLTPPSPLPLPPCRLVVLSGPSGVGKSTILRRLLERHPDRLRLSISATTRSPRPGEIHGTDYYFLSSEEFARRRAADEFLECCEVFGRGHWYGTPHSEVEPSLEAGTSVILEIDVEGTLAVVEKYPAALTIFLRPSASEELERRLRERATESEEAIGRRLEVARRELEQAGRYQHVIVNDTVAEAVEQISTILAREGVDQQGRRASDD